MAQYGVQSLVLSVFHFCKVDQVCCDQVCVIIIITMTRSSQAVCLDLIISFEVSLQSFIQLLQCVFLIIEYQFLDGCHSICISCQTRPYNTRSEVVHRTAEIRLTFSMQPSYMMDISGFGARSLCTRWEITVAYSSPLGDVLDLFLNSCIKLIICQILIQVSKIRE